MRTEQSKPLKIYSASAGSGKTFQLVQYYLKLILGDVNTSSSKSFAKILAMTFTNKAAWEMKNRVISALNELAYQPPNLLMSVTQKTTQISVEIIRKRAMIVLSEILHHYEDFNLMTIDKFSLRLIRTFNRDLDLDEGFEVVLDQKALLEQVVDNLIAEIGKPGKENITKWTYNYAKNSAEEGRKWDFKTDLFNFSQVLTKESEQDNVQHLLRQNYDDNQLENIHSGLQYIEEQHQARCKAIHEYYTSLAPNPEDYPHKMGAGGVLYKIENIQSRSLKKYAPPSATISGILDGTKVKSHHNVDERLMKMMDSLFQWEAENFEEYYTLSLLKRNFFNVALLKDIAQELKRFKQAQNLIGIYEFGQMIAQLLQNESAPFIYERLGSRYNHYLLDEFQDTSRVQWLNLIPLIHESISNNFENLIVGDPKQAIYRWRNGLVEQFVELPAIFNTEGNKELHQISQHFQQMGEKVSLDQNFRSQKNIVNFNNAFFQRILELCPESFKKYYADVSQHPCGENGGVVSIQKFSSNDKEEIIEKERIFLLQHIKKAVENGFLPGDICVLVRNKNKGTQLAKVLMEANFSVISSDSLLVASDDIVKLCIQYLKIRKNSNSISLQLKFATSFLKLEDKDPIKALQPYWKEGKVGHFDFSLFLADYFDGIKNFFFPYENMYDLGQRFLALIDRCEQKNVYLHHLMELFHGFDLQIGPDIRQFLEDWEHNYSKKSTIQMPENKQSVQVMTIHKSKGLEFPIVILPDLSWKLNMSLGKHFIKPDNNQLLYATLAKNNVPHYMLEVYAEEYSQRLLDELNVLYVAFTRPVNRLYGLLNTHLPRNVEDFSQINYLITKSIEVWQEKFIFQNEVELIVGEEGVFSSGTSESYSTSFYPKDFKDLLWFPDITLQDEDALDKEQLTTAQNTGNILHLIFSKLDKKTTVKKAIEGLGIQNTIERATFVAVQQKAIEVEEFLHEQSFFSTAEKILSEQDIIIGTQEIKRPDKVFISAQKEVVVVDFKTGKRAKKYNHQVRLYCKLLEEMDYSNVVGYLLYTDDLILEKIDG